MNDRMSITAAQVCAMLDYNENTGEFIWKPRTPEMFPHLTANRVYGWNYRFAGKVAGYVRHDRYVVIRLNGTGFFAHRLAMLIVEGEWPSEEIDHINGDPLDNRLCNLRKASRFENAQNFGVSAMNTSGHRGVHWCNTTGKWIAKIQIRGRVKHLGKFDSVEEAKSAYLRGKAVSHTFQPTPRKEARRISGIGY